MKKPMAKKVLAAVTTAAMAMSAVACGSTPAEAPAPAADEPAPAAAEETPAPAAEEEAPAAEEEAEPEEEEEEEISPYTVITDADGNTLDLGGIEVIVRDWWSPEEPAEPTNDYEEARDEYRQWIQDTYNFKIREVAISDWGSAPQDFVDYVTTGGDDNNYAFVLRGDAAVVSGMQNGLMYDLATLDCLDFTDPLFTQNKVNEMYSKGSSVYCMSAGTAEPRGVMFFNKRLLTDAGIDPESLYDMQADGSWTWDKFEELLAQCQRDTDNDGVDDVYGMTANEGDSTTMFVASNDACFVGKDSAGNFTYNLENPETQAALEWIVDIYTKYDNHDPEGAEWDYYKEEFKAGKAAFMPEGAWAGYGNGYLSEMSDELGAVMIPKGPNAKTYVNVWSNNPVAIPACYDADRAWKIAMAWKLFYSEVPGYEGYNGFLSNCRAGVYDERAVNETITMMCQEEHGVVAFHDVIPNLAIGPDFVWSVAPNADIAALTEAIAGTWQAYIDEANK